MEIAQIRRARLKAWFKERTLPPDEKSYLSQLITGKSSSFGERAARRLEKTYHMPAGYLDTPLDSEPAPAVAQTEHRDLLDAWDYLLPGERQDLLTRIKALAAHNREAVDHFKPKIIRVIERRVRQVRFEGPDRRKKRGEEDA